MNSAPAAAPAPTTPPHLRQIAMIGRDAASGAIGAACDVAGMVLKTKAAFKVQPSKKEKPMMRTIFRNGRRES
jgi:hypothetical protein